jgi:hypothetical protein
MSVIGSLSVTTASTSLCPADVRDPANFDPAARGRDPPFLSLRNTWSENLAETLGIALRPTASQCRVVVHENVRTGSDRLALLQRIYEYEKLAILITGRIKLFVVVPAELPIVEKRGRSAKPRPTVNCCYQGGYTDGELADPGQYVMWVKLTLSVTRSRSPHSTYSG